MLKNHYREIKSELEKIVQGSHRKAEVHREAKNRTNRKQKLTGQKKQPYRVTTHSIMFPPEFLNCFDLYVPIISTCLREMAQRNLHVRWLYSF